MFDRFDCMDDAQACVLLGSELNCMLKGALRGFAGIDGYENASIHVRSGGLATGVPSCHRPSPPRLTVVKEVGRGATFLDRKQGRPRAWCHAGLVRKRR